MAYRKHGSRIQEFEEGIFAWLTDHSADFRLITCNPFTSSRGNERSLRDGGVTDLKPSVQVHGEFHRACDCMVAH